MSVKEKIQEKRERRLQIAAVIASRVEINQTNHGTLEGDAMTYSEPRYPDPEEIAERALEIADALIALVDGNKGPK